MATSIAFVTGGNTGLGYEIVKALLQSTKPYHVFLGSRSLEKADRAIESLRKECPDVKNTVEAIQLDLNNDESIERAFEKVKVSQARVDVVVNNAGGSFDGVPRDQITPRAQLMKTYEVNTAGTYAFTYTFIPLLLKSSTPRLLFVTGLYSVDESTLPFFPPVNPGWPKSSSFDPIGYMCSKAALNVMMQDWNRKLSVDGVKVWAVAPGFLETDLGGARERAKQLGAEHPSAGGEVMRRVVEGEFDEHVGKIVSKWGVMAG